MNQEKLLQLQARRGAKVAAGTDTSTRSLEAVTEECRKVISEQAASYRDMNALDKKEKIRQIITKYVFDNKPLVVGYIDAENNPDPIKLADKLVEKITDYDILSQAMMNDDIFEIRCNEKEIKVEINGRVTDLLDRDGQIVSFTSPEQQNIVMRKLLGDERLTPKDCIVSARTIEGYRICAIHCSAISPDPNNPTGEQYHAFVLRKFKKSKMKLGDIVKKGTLSDNMARLLALCPAGGLAFVTVGPTASGKTTTNNAILQAVPLDTRTLLMQNPSEIDLRTFDASGRNIRDCLHLEAREIINPTPKDPTMENLMDAALRLSPTFVCLGEIRTNVEFKQAMKIMNAGHPLNTTYHAESAQGAVSRFLEAYLSSSGNVPSHLALSNLTNLLNIIIVQKIMRDGKRRIIQITEVEGVDPDNPNQPKLNDIYRFVLDGDPEYDEDGKVKKIYGHHQRVGCLSNKAIEKMRLEGVAPARFDFASKPVDEHDIEVETYTGQDIETYHMKRGGV